MNSVLLRTLSCYDDNAQDMKYRDLTPSADEMTAFVQELKNFPRLKNLQFINCHGGDDWIQPLLDALPESSITGLVLGGELTAASMHALGKALVKAPQVRMLDLSKNLIGDDGMAILAQYLPDTRVRIVRVNECGIGQEGIKALAGVVAESTQMLAVETLENPGTNLIGEGYAATLEALMKNRSVMIWKFRNYPNGDLTRTNVEVEEGYEALEHRFAKEASLSLQEFLAPSRVGVANQVADKNKRVAGQYLSQISANRYTAKDMPLPLRKAVFEREAIMVRLAKFPEESNRIGDYISFQKTMPVLRKDDDITFEAAFAADPENGMTPLDNPETWANHPDLFSKIMAEAEDTSTQLHGTMTASGKDLQDYALTMIGAGEVIRQLNELGVMLHAELLLDAEDKPNALLRAAMMQQGGVVALFQEENWIEGTQADLNALLRAMPEAAKNEIPNLHGLRAQIGRQQKQVRSVA